MTPIQEANTLIHYQAVTKLGKEFPELCDGHIALWIAVAHKYSQDVVCILQEYIKVEESLKNKISMV